MRRLAGRSARQQRWLRELSRGACRGRRQGHLDGTGPEDLRIPQLLARAAESGAVEVILATNATVDGQTTAHYIADRLADLEKAGREIKVSALAHGVPVGGELDYLDDGTLSTALRDRRSI